MSTPKPPSTTPSQSDPAVPQPPHEAHRGHHASKPGDAPRKDQKSRRGLGFWLVLCLSVLVAGGWLVNFVHRAIVYEETEDAYVSGHLHMVSSRLDGSVTEVLVEENQSVKTGQVLARLDPLGAELTAAKNRAALHAAQADVLRAETGVDQAKAEFAQARAQRAVAAAQVQQAEAQLDLANVTSTRNEGLLKSDTRTIAEAEVDTSRSVASASAASLVAVKAGLAAAEARVQVGAAGIASAQAQEASAKARVEAAQEAVLDAERELSYATILAPADGRIGNKNVEVGNRVQVGQALFALVERHYWITANFKETQLKKMQSGQVVEVTIDAFGGREFIGKVDSIAPATGAQFALLPPDNATGNFTKVVQRVPVKIIFDQDSIAGFEDRLSPGLSAVVSVRVK